MQHLRIIAAAAALATATASFAAKTYVAPLSGANEVPAVVTTGTGFAKLVVDGNILTVDVTFSDLIGTLADGHIHCCVAATGNAPVAIGFGGLPLGSQSGSFSLTFDLDDATIYRSSFIGVGTAADAKALLLDAFGTERAYVNLHTSTFRGGEIRGQIAAIPEPASWAMMIAGFGLVGMAVRRRAAVAA